MQEARCRHEVVFQHNDAAVAVDDVGYAVNDVGGQTVVAVALYAVYRFESFNGMDVAAHQFDVLVVVLGAGPVGKHKKFAFLSQWVVGQRLHRVLQMPGTVVGKE